MNSDGNPDSSIIGNVNYNPWYGNEERTSLRGVPDGDTYSYVIPEDFNATSSDYELTIPASTTVTGTSAWTGEINPPTDTTLSNKPPRSSMREIIEVGFADGKLILSQAAKLVFYGEHGKKVGYTRSGESFTEITTVCGENSQTWADANLGTEGDCKIDAVNDLVVWTKHFTTFATYVQSSGAGGGSSGSSIINQYNNLIAQCKIQEAEALKAQWPSLFPNSTVAVTTSTMSVSQFIQLLINLGIIPQDKVVLIKIIFGLL